MNDGQRGTGPGGNGWVKRVRSGNGGEETCVCCVGETSSTRRNGACTSRGMHRGTNRANGYHGPASETEGLRAVVARNTSVIWLQSTMQPRREQGRDHPKILQLTGGCKPFVSPDRQSSGQFSLRSSGRFRFGDRCYRGQGFPTLPRIPSKGVTLGALGAITDRAGPVAARCGIGS